MSSTTPKPHYNDIERHTTGVSAQLTDFFKHDCPRKEAVWVDGQQVQRAIQVKGEFNSIRGNENMVPVNARATDRCPFCNLSIEDPSFIPCTKADLEALSK